MTESIVDIRDRIRPRLPQAAPTLTAGPTQEAPSVSGSEDAFVVESSETGKIVLTMPVRETAQVSAEDFLLRLSGRLVEAEKANGNGAFWSQGDLEFGLPSIAYGPLNWLHQERRIVGVLTGATLVDRDVASDAPINPFVQADAVLWKYLYPTEAREVERAASDRQLWYSMECVANQVECVGEGSCGTRVPYRERSSANACDHIRQRTAHRRLVDPIFQGAAIIVPPVQPGWANADLAVTRQAASLVEEQGVSVEGLTTSDAERMVAQVLAYANTR